MNAIWRPPSEARAKRSGELAMQNRRLEAGWYLIQPDIVLSLRGPDRAERAGAQRQNFRRIEAEMNLHGVVVGQPGVALAYLMGAHQTYARIAQANAKGDARMPRSSVMSAWLSFSSMRHRDWSTRT